MGSWGLFPSGGGVVCRSEIEKVGVPGGGMPGMTPGLHRGCTGKSERCGLGIPSGGAPSHPTPTHQLYGFRDSGMRHLGIGAAVVERFLD